MKSDIPANIIELGGEMGRNEMGDWPDERPYVLKRMDNVDKRFDKMDERFDKMSDQIDSLKVEIIKLASNMGSFKSEFRLKTSAWAFLGTAIALSLAVIGYLIKNQLV